MEKINKAHGAGGNETSGLINEIFKASFSNEYLNDLSDSAVVPGAERIAVTTDSFVVKPVFFPGGDIGRLSVCGTVNDLLMSGARPAYLTAGFILEEGLDMESLKTIVRSMAETAKEAGVRIITGDTKVIEPSDPSYPGLIINTSGIGVLGSAVNISPSAIEKQDVVILSGDLGDHHAAILSERLSVSNDIRSDAAPLTEMVSALMKDNIEIHAMRDVTRGGLATILNEFSEAADMHIYIEEKKLPVAPKVSAFCGLLGLDPLYMGNEGKAVFIIRKEDGERALDIIRHSRYGEKAAIIGGADEGEACVTVKTAVGGERVISPLFGEGLPRIC